MGNTKNNDGIKRQAVVIIHGIGEQRPMDTLRGFVNALLHQENEENQYNDKKDQPYYSKPDTISDSYELRRIKLKKFTDRGDDDWYETDFLEYYFAHHMSGTEWWHVLSWIRRILHRSLRDVKDSANHKHKAYENHINHKRLGLLYALTCAFIIVAIVAVRIVAEAITAFIILTWSLPVFVILDILIVVLALVACFMFQLRLSPGLAKNTIGDAARYLDVAPANIARALRHTSKW